MDVTNVAITLGTSFFVMVTAIAVGVAVPYIQLRRELERERRQRSREVRSEPLLRLREVVAQTATEHGEFLMALRLLMRDPQNKLLVQDASKALKKFDDFLNTRNWLRTVYTVTYPEIHSEFKKLWEYWTQCTQMFSQMLEQYLKGEREIDTNISNLDYEIEEGIFRLQSLINKRLEE